MSKLKKEELLSGLNGLSKLLKTRWHEYNWSEKDSQFFKQIKEILREYFNGKTES